MDEEPVVSLLASCLRCGRMFMCNPLAVPAIRGEPLCRECFELLNAHRVALGFQPWELSPDAYEPLPASEL